MVGSTTKEKHDAEDDEAQDSDYLDRGKPEFRFAIDADCEDVEKNNSDEYDSDPCRNRSVGISLSVRDHSPNFPDYVHRAVPIVYDNTCS